MNAAELERIAGRCPVNSTVGIQAVQLSEGEAEKLSILLVADVDAANLVLQLQVGAEHLVPDQLDLMLRRLVSSGFNLSRRGPSTP